MKGTTHVTEYKNVLCGINILLKLSTGSFTLGQN
jgi:hypothetical protein